MDNDPEMYRGDPRLCSAHLRIRELQEELAEAKRDRDRALEVSRRWKEWGESHEANTKS
jgi:hypothetical protein